MIPKKTRQVVQRVERMGLRKCTGCGKEEITARTRHGRLRLVPYNDVGGGHHYEVLPCGEMILKEDPDNALP